MAADRGKKGNMQTASEKIKRNIYVQMGRGKTETGPKTDGLRANAASLKVEAGGAGGREW